MAIFNLGSINLDYFYRLPHLVSAGETLAAVGYDIFLGGKGANQSVALSKAGAHVSHIGAFGKRDEHYLREMREAGVNLNNIALLETESGHAVVMVDNKTGENQIVLSGSANNKISKKQIESVLSNAKTTDWALAQNETSLVHEFLVSAKEKGLKICYSAAPFVAKQTASLLPFTDLLVVNEGEANALIKRGEAQAASTVLTQLKKAVKQTQTKKKGGGRLKGSKQIMNPRPIRKPKGVGAATKGYGKGYK